MDRGQVLLGRLTDRRRVRLKKMLQVRVADGSLMQLVGKCLHVGILDGAQYSEPDTGTVQGSGSVVRRRLRGLTH